jgi:ribonuclease P protein component
MADRRFPPCMHVRSTADFQRTYKRRCSAGDNILVVLGHLNGLEHPRLGLSVSRKVGNAVVRNRWKRRLREAFRLNREALPQGVDLVVIPRAADEPPFEVLCEALIRLAQRVAKRLARPSS